MHIVDLTGAGWHTSSRSSQTGQCVEVAVVSSRPTGAPVVAVRDSLDPTGPVLTFTATQWQAFLTRLTGTRLTGTGPTVG